MLRAHPTKNLEGKTTENGNFKLIKKINGLEEFSQVVNSQKSIFWNFKIMPTAFFLSWQLRLIERTIKNGFFYEVENLKENKKEK